MNINLLEDYNITSSWFSEYFKHGSDYFERSSIGPNQKKVFKRFLRASNLLHPKKNEATPFFDAILGIGPESSLAWGLILIESAIYNPQIRWYIKNMALDANIALPELESQIASASPGSRPRSLCNAFTKLCATQFGDLLNFGSSFLGEKDEYFLRRTKPNPPDPRVYLYGLYKFAEACGGYYQMTLSRLLDYDVESAGVSPSEIFGLTLLETEQYLHELAQSYPGFVIAFSTTHGLELLTLNPEETSTDVLELF